MGLELRFNPSLMGLIALIEYRSQGDLATALARGSAAAEYQASCQDKSLDDVLVAKGPLQSTNRISPGVRPAQPLRTITSRTIPDLPG